ncbi:Translation initiation factor 3 subunit c [Bacidia gigantensis]|uniref:Translation initiation factor 3 subunit c n=1 Tax=Bacidia gigantensis TaxID=2732470 RepID=UPI001D048EBC|nr:Translation initiation factor 3 subunit c [Bacidia gigantensis]KAG8530024.1 Translation initiation factor 3 subunit c [Bacidia gigantensis]
MSRFFTAGDSSSESSSSDEEELYSDQEQQQGEEEESSEEEEEEEDEGSSSSDEGGKTGGSRFLRDAASSDESEDEDKVTVVKSAKDKRHEELEGIVRLIENASKIGDWSTISTEFDRLNRQVIKITVSEKPPKSYVKIISDLEDLMNDAIAKQKVSTKKMNATNAKGLNIMKQKIKRNNKDYMTEIDKYREDKADYMMSDEEEEIVQEKVKKPKQTYIESGDPGDEGYSTVGRGGKTLQYTPESILKHLRSIVESRGKKNTDKTEQIRIMEKLLEVADTPYRKIRVLITLVATRFDMTSGSNAESMKPENWKAAEHEFRLLLQALEDNSNMVVVENAEEWEDDDKPPQPAAGEKLKIPGSVVSVAERLDDELTRSLQHIDPHTAEYIERLTDEQALYNDILRALLYVEGLKRDPKLDQTDDGASRVIMRRLEHVYFKPAQVVHIQEENAWNSIPSQLNSTTTPREVEANIDKLVQTLSTFLFKHSADLIRARAYLCQVYYFALHDQYYKARDMLLMSHLQETIANFPINTQILYNRTLVQVGLCAFRANLVYEAQSTLQEICGSGRQKELLAQGVMIQRYSQVTQEQERLERQRQLPFHMHINLELLECVYLTCSMLLEIPLLAQTGSSPDVRKRVISKTYRRLLEFHERQIFTGPAENTRDHIMQASRALAAGEWKKSVDLTNSIKIWDLMPEPGKIKAMLSAQIQEEGLRTYLFTYAPFYDTLSVSTLASMFDLSERKVTAVVSKMISHEDLAAALDQVNDAIVFRKGVELSRLQSLALTLSDKASGLIESNERTLEQRTQGMTNAFERQGGAGGRGGRGGRGGQRGQRNDRGGSRLGGQQFGGGALGNAIKA